MQLIDNCLKSRLGHLPYEGCPNRRLMMNPQFIILSSLRFYCPVSHARDNPFLAENIHQKNRNQYQQIRRKGQIVLCIKLSLEHILCKL